MDETRRAHELTRVLEASPDPVAVLEPSGEVIVWANDAMRRLTGDTSTAADVRLLDVLDSWSQAEYVTTALTVVSISGTCRGGLPPRGGGLAVSFSAVLVALR